MPRYFEPITEDEFREKLKATSIAHYKRKGVFDDPDIQNRFSNGEWLWRTPWCEVNDTIVKDLSKIRFYAENWLIVDYDMRLAGLITLPNDMPCLGVLAGGDGEVPVFCVLYWDGKKVRGYVPENGNLFNPDTRAAWGDMDSESDVEEDDHNALIKMGYEPDEDDCAVEFVESHMDYDCDALEADIMARIVAK